ncbi:MAG TPA: hypothetical protein DCS19_03425, partial [Flavobacterium sp.]|nr:hypothetical protein [Flavobacterium sp.]
METIGLVPQSAVDRQILDGSKYDHLFAKPKLKDEIVKRDAHATDTVQQMIKIVNNHYQEVANAVPLVKVVKDGKIDVKATCKKLFDLVFNYVKYNREDGEKLRTPAMTWYHAQVMARKYPNNPKYSADCDCFSIFIASFLKNMGIPYVFRITGYKDYFGMVGDWQHVYVVVPQNDKNIIIDPVTNYFDYQKQPAKKRDFNMYGQEVALQGVDIHVLSGTDDLSGRRRQPRFQRGKKYRFKKREFIQLNSRPNFLREELLRIKQIAVKNPKLMRGYNPQQVKKWIDDLLEKWNDTSNFLTYLATIAREEKDLIRKKQLPQSLGEEYVSGDLELQGYFGALYDAHTDFLGEIYDAVYGIDELVGSLEEADIRELEGVESEALSGFGEVDLGKLKRPKVKALLKKIAAPVKKVVKVAAKVAKAPVRIAAKVVKATVKIPTAVVKRVVVKAKAKQERKKVLKKAKIAKKVARKTQKVARKTQKVNTKKSKFLKKIPIPEQEIVDQNPYMEQEQEIVDQNPYME